MGSPDWATDKFFFSEYSWLLINLLLMVCINIVLAQCILFTLICWWLLQFQLHRDISTQKSFFKLVYFRISEGNPNIMSKIYPSKNSNWFIQKAGNCINNYTTWLSPLSQRCQLFHFLQVLQKCQNRKQMLCNVHQQQK